MRVHRNAHIRGQPMVACWTMDQTEQNPSTLVDLPKELRRAISEGLSPAEALDYTANILGGYSQSEWADIRGVERQAVTKNVQRAREKLEP